jgi:hypothetical protein
MEGESFPRHQRQYDEARLDDRLLAAVSDVGLPLKVRARIVKSIHDPGKRETAWREFPDSDPTVATLFDALHALFPGHNDAAGVFVREVDSHLVRGLPPNQSEDSWGPADPHFSTPEGRKIIGILKELDTETRQELGRLL